MLDENFDEDGVFPPTGWSVINTNANPTPKNWIQNNSSDHPFSNIDTDNVFSALVAFDDDYPSDEWLITNELTLTDCQNAFVNFWAGIDTDWLAGANPTLEVTTDDGTSWTELWNVEDDGNFTTDWAWVNVTVDLTAYIDQPIKLAWTYTGQGGNLYAIDNVQVETVTTTDVTTAVIDNAVKIYSHYNVVFVDVLNTDFIDSKVSIYSISGQEVYTEKISSTNNRIVLDNVSAGTYFVKISSNENNVTQKVYIK